ncbi:hypothetical protein N5C39_22580 [Enterobacter bugandensis]|uniref:Phage replisome organizer n=1 Tax=Enterobacter bugandensis TaxID=881260 RepID=A0AA42PVR0_9ENTR|nr:hypothetical protein [Enterobacter bugandensis]MDH1321161.1 hypothetical protein [Enterobacter bugandensis]
MANSWLRLWHDMPNDPKWRTIAKISGQPIALVQAIYLQLLVSASQNPVTDETGVTLHVVTVTNEDIASALDVTVSNVDSVTDAMQGRVLDGNTISGWDKRQAPSVNHRNPGKPAKSGAQRVREYRERKKLEAKSNENVTTSNVTETSRNVVTPQIRKEEIREDLKELKDPPLNPPKGKSSGNKFDPLSVELPEWLSPELWAEWVAYRKQLGKPIKTQQGVSGSINKLAAYREQGHSPEYVVGLTMSNEWRGLLVPDGVASKPRRDVNVISQPDKKVPDGFRG